MMTSKEIRQSFLDFFASKDHKIVPSAPMVIKDDPTLMFTNAGMNQFKNIILGNDPIKYSRVADSQKCLRVSGKHNDLEEVGHDTYHHTMFEMLGNWSFGDYFKKEAIEWAWEYLTDWLKLDKNRLYVTVFEGSPAENLGRDDEAAQIWAQFLPADRIINGNKKDNFWEMGDTGPCGPCSEIHIDIRPDDERAKVDGLTLVNQSHPQVIEIWNNVFMQFNRKADGSLEELPAKVIDTGMGFERLCMSIQGTTSNYDTDIFQPILKEIGKITNHSYGENEKTDIAMRVIADHIRTIAFSITDGQLPSNAKAGYVIRRILRRAVRYGYTFLAQRQAFMCKLIDVLCDVMGGAYPELISQKSLIEKVIKEEEESFLRTLETGIKLLDKLIDEARKIGKTEISGVDTFTLYDTFGFPLDLTELILREHEMTANIDEFNAEMQKQKERARNAAAVETGDWVTVREGDSVFVGYDKSEIETEILRYRKVSQKNKSYYQIVLSETPFYAEMGGQVGDNGNLIAGDESIEIFDTKKENNLSVHLSNTLPKDITATFTAKIDTEKRQATANNHTATHLLHEALREVLGTHVEQKGSYVNPESLRFDFSHFQKMTKEEIRAVETIANRKIRENYPLEEMRETPIAKAQEMGAMALFGEKYGETVRVIRFGSSTELCGGTHVQATGNIGIVKIVSESSIAAGVRRLEAITGKAVEELIDNVQDTVNNAKELFNNVPDLNKAIQKTLDENSELKKQVESFMHERIMNLRDKLIADAKEENGVKVIRFRTDLSTDAVKTLSFQIKNVVGEKLFVAIGSIYDGKPSLTVLLTDDLVAQGHNAVNITREAAKLIQGGGGGQAHFATAGGKNAEGLDKAMELMKIQGINTKQSFSVKKTIGRSIERRLYWTEEIRNLSGNFGNDYENIYKELVREIEKDGIVALIDHLRLCGSIPESYGRDSSEEKLYSKYTDSLLALSFQQLGLRSLVLSERADAADVEVFADNYSFVADAKAFRLSRTAKNQKDFKVSAMNNWKKGKPNAMIVCPIYQLPRSSSQIYQTATSNNVCIFTYSHLALLLTYSQIEGIEKAQNLLKEIFKIVPLLPMSKNATDYWIGVNKTIHQFSDVVEKLWSDEKQAALESIEIAKEEDLIFLAKQRENIMRLSHNDALNELVKLEKIDSKIKIIKSIKDNGLFSIK